VRRVLVTGGAGFIGSAAVRALVSAEQYEVLNLDALTYAGNLDSLANVSESPRYRFVRGDIRDPGLLRSVLRDFRPTAVLHLAAESHVDRSIDAPGAFVDTNIVGTYALLNESLRYWQALDPADAAAFRFIHVSTDEVFGSLGTEGRFTEASPYAPRSPYAASKASADHLARAWHATYGLPVIVTNCSNNYGPYQFPEKLIPLMTLNALAGQELPVYGAGANVRDWLYVDDHVDALRLVLEAGDVGATYLVGGDGERTNLQVVEAICAIVDEMVPAAAPRRKQIRFVDDRPGHDFRYAIDASRVRDELGWRPRHHFDAGLRATVSWYLANREWCERVQRGAYRRERLGLGAAVVR
jgi:dTDP-glucose 4,6-dehydratase